MVPAADASSLSPAPALCVQQLLPPRFPLLLIPLTSGLGMSLGSWHGLMWTFGLP